MVIYFLSVIVDANQQSDEKLKLQHLIGVEGNTYLSQGDYQRAERAFRALVRSSPDSWAANYALASTLLNQCRLSWHVSDNLALCSCEWFDSYLC